MADKILTIVVPTYNTEALLPRCLDSLFVQLPLMDLLEVLIVIDGSPDNSVEIAKRYEEKFPNTFKVINKKNGGHGSTINIGLELATGKYFKVLDSDDWFDNREFIEFLYHLTKTDVDIFLTDYTKEFLQENRQEHVALRNFLPNHVFALDEFEYDIASYDTFAMARTTYKTSCLRESKIFLLEKTFYVDSILVFVPLFFAKTVYYSPFNLYRYYIGREDQSTSTQNILRNRFHRKKVIEYLYEYTIENKSLLSLKKRRFLLNQLNGHFSKHLLILNKLPYCEAKRETNEWNIKVKGLQDYKELNSKSFMLYNLVPYWLFRLIAQRYTKMKKNNQKII